LTPREAFVGSLGMSNVLSDDKKQQIIALGKLGWSLRRIEQAIGVRRERFGLHNLRHSLSNWLVNKAKIEPKMVQGILRHTKIQTTLDLYTQEDSDETRAAQGEYLMALGVSTNTVQ